MNRRTRTYPNNLAAFQHAQQLRLHRQRQLADFIEEDRAAIGCFKEAVAKKTFREDLFFRINQAEINLLPLRDRREDILPLIEYFWKEANIEHDRNVSKITPDALRMLHNYDWPGNIRELRNVINLLVALCDGDTLDTSDLASRPEINRSREIVPVAKPMLNATLDEITKIAIEHALQQNNGNRERTAKQLGIPVRTLYRKLKEYDLN